MIGGFLDRESIFELTQAKQPRKQAQILARLGIPFLQDGIDGYPKTTWSILHEVLSNQIPGPQKGKWKSEIVELNPDAIKEVLNGKKKNREPD